MTITRFELIDWTNDGRYDGGWATTIWEPADKIAITYELQDDGRTLKVFISDAKSKRPSTPVAAQGQQTRQSEGWMAAQGGTQETTKGLSYEQEVHAMLWAALANTEDLLRYFEAQFAQEKGDAKALTQKCIEWKRDDLRRLRTLIPQALDRRFEAGVAASQDTTKEK